MLTKIIKINFGARIFISFLVLLLCLQFVTAWLVYRESFREVENQIEQQLQVANRLFQQEFTNRRANLNSIVKVVARDWAFRRAIGAADLITLKDVLDSYSRRIGADLAIYSDQEESLFASTVDMSQADRIHMEKILTDRIKQPIFSVDSQHFILVTTQVRSPNPKGWLAMGFRVDNKLANYFKSITQLETSFVQSHADTLSLVATTLEQEDSLLTLEAFKFTKPSDRFRPHYLTGNKYVIQSGLVLYQSPKGELIAIQQASTRSHLSRLMSWWFHLVLLFALALFALGGIALLIARSVTQPIRALLSAAKKITSGNYSGDFEDKSIDLNRHDEIGELSREFQSMQRAVAMREKEIRYRADFSALTGLPNRDYFLGCLASDIDSNPDLHIGVFVINLTRFKDVNDTLGHHIGDRLLKQIADRLLALHSIEHLSHLGADQFAIIEIDASLSRLQEKCTRILAHMAAPFELESIQLSVTYAMGLSVFPLHSNDAGSLLRCAEVAMFNCKKSSVDFVIYDSSQDGHSVKRLTLLGELPSAIENTQLILNYQPTLEFIEGEPFVSKVECLVRWIHPTLGFIPPDEFIPLAEQTGTITKLTHWVLETAIEQCSGWLESGKFISVAVNISTIDLFKGNLKEFIPALLKKYNVPASLLTLEVTESAVVEDIDQAIKVLKQLKTLGLKLSIDDYGTGYSSLAQLKHLPVDELKIDKSFVLELPSEQDDCTIVRSTIELAHLMGLKVVAEGVENQASLDFLMSHQCDFAQGFFISKPINSSALNEWFNETKFAIRS